MIIEFFGKQLNVSRREHARLEEFIQVCKDYEVTAKMLGYNILVGNTCQSDFEKIHVYIEDESKYAFKFKLIIRLNAISTFSFYIRDSHSPYTFKRDKNEEVEIMKTAYKRLVGEAV